MPSPRDPALQTMSKPPDARIVRTRARLEEALLRLLAERRLDDIAVADVVAEAEVGYATFFRHYTDKQQLWDTVAQRLIDGINEHLGGWHDPADRHLTSLAICGHVEQHRDQYRVLLAGGGRDQVRGAMLAAAFNRRSPADDPAAIGLPPTLATEFAVNAVFAILAWWLGGHDDQASETIADAMDRLVWSPIFGPPETPK